jgi:transposase
LDVLHGLLSRCVSGVRMVAEQAKEPPSHWASMRSVSDKAGCRAETLRRWVRHAERDTGQRPGLPTTECERPKELERENRELRRANEIPRKSASFA